MEQLNESGVTSRREEIIEVGTYNPTAKANIGSAITTTQANIGGVATIHGSSQY